MKITTYGEFCELVRRTRILPFSGFIPEHPSLADAASDCGWHTGLDTDPWTWRIRIVSDGAAAYGKFFGDKASFIHPSLFPSVRAALSSGRTVEERYRDGLLSNTAWRLYQLLLSEGNVDSRLLRKLAGLNAREDKKEYERSLVELQNFGDVVITGARESDTASGWSSMCYELADSWLSGTAADTANAAAARSAEHGEESLALQEELAALCSDKAYRYFMKKFRWK
jgi:hypothetical protein